MFGNLLNKDGNWGSWGDWSTCSATCGTAMRERSRYCNNPRTQGDGKYCSHDGSNSNEMEDCDTGISCPTYQGTFNKNIKN